MTKGKKLPVARSLRQVPRLALDLLFPLQCLGCRKEGRLLCSGCVARLPRLERPYCPVCAQPKTPLKCRRCRQALPWYDGIRAPYLMAGPVREAIHALKYRGVRAAAPELGRLLAQFLLAQPLPGDLLVPVPLHPNRLRERGYNQSALLARQLARHTGLSIDEALLTRVKDSPPQVRAATRDQRRQNVDATFRCEGAVAGRAVILVDDVATSGSTLSACAAALKASGSGPVWGLVLAREG